jgi:hypothetical protein
VHDFGERLLRKPGKSDFDPSSSATLFPTTTMPASNSHTEDGQMVEVRGNHTGDEAELARMGYKQELKYVQFSSSIHSRLLKFMGTRYLPGVI